MGCGACRLRASPVTHGKHSQLPGDLPDWSPRLLQHHRGGGHMRRDGRSCLLPRVLGTGAALCGCVSAPARSLASP